MIEWRRCRNVLPSNFYCYFLCNLATYKYNYMNMKIKWSTTLWISSPNTNELRLHYHSLKSWPFVFSWWRLLLHQFKPRYNINSTLMSRKSGISAKLKSMLIKIFTGSLSFKVILKLIHFCWHKSTQPMFYYPIHV